LMRRLAICIATLVVAVAAALGATGSRASSDKTGKPLLRLANTAPISVVGARFHSRERIKVTLGLQGTTTTKRIRASGSGSFRTAFARAAGRCVSFHVSAVGAAGDKAVLKHVPAPACMPA